MILTIRAAEPDEAQAIWRLTREAYEPEQGRLDPPSGVFKETAAEVRRAIEAGAIYVAAYDAAIVGAARVEPAAGVEHVGPADGAGALYCGRVAVHPAAQRHGIGTALMRRVERHAAEAGYAAVVLGVRVGLPENLLFYERLGYRVVGQASHGGYTVPTFYHLRKDLT